MTSYWYNAFLTPNQNYVLLDGDGGIRASSPDLEGIMLAKKEYGFGSIHKIKYEGDTIKIGKEVKVNG